MHKLGGRSRRIVGAFQRSAAFLADDDRARFHQTNAVAEQFTALLWVEHRADRTELDHRQPARPWFSPVFAPPSHPIATLHTARRQPTSPSLPPRVQPDTSPHLPPHPHAPLPRTHASHTPTPQTPQPHP